MTVSDIDIILNQAAKQCVFHSNTEVKPHQCYSEFSLNNEEYKISDYVVLKQKNQTKIGQLLCMFMDEKGSFYMALKIDENNKEESNYITELTSIVQKYDTSCLGTDELLSNKKDRVLSEMNSNSPLTNLTSPFNRTPGTISTPTNYKDDVKEVYPDEERTVTTPRRNSVKRDLNKSFGDVLDYSIVEPAVENSLKLKLRKSCRIVENSPVSSVRKSARNTQRKSYAEYISPLKPRQKSEDDCWSPKFSQRTSKVVRSLDLSDNSAKNNEPSTPSRRRTKHIPERKSVSSARTLRPKGAVTYYHSDDDDILFSPIENRLNDSLRTTTLRINLEKLDIKEANKKSEICDNNEKQEKNTENTPPSTPRKRRNRVTSISDCLVEPSPKTPRSKRNIKQKEKYSPSEPTKTPSKTPKNRAKLIRDGVITPSMQNRSKALQGDSTPLMKARSQLHVSYVPKSLPCREKEYADVYGFLQGKLLDGCGGCMYVSGVPGTGKTATVTSVINSLQGDKSVPKFTLVSINGMKLTEPRQSYVEIVKQLTGKSVPWEQAQSMLDDMFVKSKKQKPVIMLIDELDILCTKRQDVVYNLLDWPTKAKNQLVVITIANTMDLPERLLMSRVTSRLGLTRLTFQAYTYKQLQEIVTMRLTGTNTFNPDAVQFVARKVASVSGDARRALDICRRAAEIAEAEGKFELVNMNHVNEALNLMITQPKVQAIKHCSFLEQLILQSIVGEVERTGVEETNFIEMFKMLTSHTAIEGFKMVSTTVALTAVAKLGACRLILTDPKCNNIHQRIVLNVSADDVFYALKNA